MASSMFKNFDYSLINSTVSNHKEVLVTYLYKDKAARQYLFIKEVKGKGNDYYLSEAKNIINKMIKNGKLAKGSNKFVKGSKKAQRGGAKAKKPILVAASCVLAAGALGAGGYFLGSYLGGGNANSFTVTLLPGDGYFPDGSKAHLTFTGVKKGTILNKLDGYMIPSNDYNLDFEAWTNIQGEQFTETTVVNSDLVLTASFYEGPEYYKAQTIEEIEGKIADLIEAKLSEETEIVKGYKTVLGLTKQIFDNELVEGIEQLKSLQNLADLTLDAISTHDPNDSSAITSELATMQNLSEQLKDVDNTRALLLLKVAASYEKAKVLNTDGIIGSIYTELNNYISNVDESLLHILDLIAPEAMANIYKISLDINPLYKENPQIFVEILNSGAEFINENDNLSDEQIKECGTLISNYLVAFSKAVPNATLTDLETFYESARNDFITALAAEEDQEWYTIKYKLRFEGMVAMRDIGNVDIVNPTEQYYNIENVATLIQEIINDFESYYFDETISKDRIVPAVDFALSACRVCKNIPEGDKGFIEKYEEYFDLFVDSNDLYHSLYQKALEALAHYPSVSDLVCFKQKGEEFSYAQVFNAVEDAKNNIIPKASEAGKETITMVQLARIESLAYSPFITHTIVDSESWLEPVNTMYKSVIEDCLKEELSESAEFNARILVGSLIGLSKLSNGILANRTATIPPQPLMSGLIYDWNKFLDFFNYVNPLNHEQKIEIADSLSSWISFFPARYRYYFLDTSSLNVLTLLISNVDYFTQLNGGNFVRMTRLLTELKKCLCGAYGDYLYEYIDYSKSVAEVQTMERIRIQTEFSLQVLGVLMDSSYPEKLRFDSIFDTFHKEFYSKLSPNMNIAPLMSALMNRVLELIK